MTAAKKITHITTVHPLRATRIFHRQCAAAVQAGFDVSLVVQHEAKEERIEGVKVIGLATYRTRLARFFIGGYQAYRLARQEDADIYQIHDPELLLFVGLLLRIRGYIVIYDAHEDMPLSLINRVQLPERCKKLIASILRQVENFLAKKMSAVIAATPKIRDKFSTIGCRVIDIKNYPITSVFIKDSPPSGDALCYVGGISKVRGIVEIINALPATGMQLQLCGQFLPASFQQTLQQLPGWKWVNYRGVLSQSAVADVMQTSFAGLVTLYPLTNYVDALPVKLFEYMASGLPVIASDFPLWRQIIEQDRCGLLVDPKDVGQITQAILWLKANPEEAKAMGKRGREAVLREYSWEREQQRLLVLYNDLMDDEK